MKGRLRKPRRREWPGFLGRLIPDSTWQRLSRTANKSWDPRTRWSFKYIVLCWVVMSWSIQVQLTDRFREGCQTLCQMFYSRRRCGMSYQGLIKATQRLGVSLFHQFWQDVQRTIPQRVGQAWTWFGWTVFAVDGSRIRAPRTKDNEKGLGKSGRDKSHPQWWITRLLHLPSKMMWDWRQGPGKSSERKHLRDMIPSLPDRSLLVGDIGFGGFDLLWELHKKKVSFLIRVGGNTNLLARHSLAQIARKGEDGFVYLWPQNSRRKTPLRVRMIVLKKPRRQPVYLLTNVMESTQLSRRTARTFYEARWGVEVEFRGLKQTMKHDKVLARTPKVGAMELAAYLVGMALLLLYTALVQGARVARLSLAGVLRVIRWAIEALRHAESCRRLQVLLRDAVIDDYQRQSSKDARDYPRKKNEPSPGPPKMRRLAIAELTRIEGLWRQYQMVFG